MRGIAVRWSEPARRQQLLGAHQPQDAFAAKGDAAMRQPGTVASLSRVFGPRFCPGPETGPPVGVSVRYSVERATRSAAQIIVSG